jgi:arginine N-succinyltransferase
MLWDHLGRRFINLSYREADAFSRTSKEFITSLFPDVEIYASLLPAEARRLIGHVSPDAVPALRMLERLGFHHIDEVDPFDGGPYLEAERDEIPLVRSTATASFKSAVPESEDLVRSIVCTHHEGDFRAIRSAVRIDDDGLCLPTEAAHALGLEPGMPVSWTPQGSSTGHADQASAGEESLAT